MSSNRAKLTAAEIGVLWAVYIFASINECMLKHLHAKAGDDECRQALANPLGYLSERRRTIAEFFRSEDIPLPLGFGDEDVDTAAPRLFADNLAFDFLRHQAAVAVGSFAYSLQVAARPDVGDFIRREMSHSVVTNKLVTELMLARGVFVRSPIVAVGDGATYVRRTDFLGSLLGPGRPLTMPEITHLHVNIEANRLGKDLLIGFSQVARSLEVREYFRRGADIAGKDIEIFSQALRREDIPAATIWDSRVTASTVPPFSDRFMLTNVGLLGALGLSNYGFALGASMRADLQADYARLMAETMEYSKDGANLAIKNGWLEEPPQAVDRRELALMR